MKKEKLQEYTLRITQSNRTQLVVVIYEIILSYLEDARETGVQGDWEGFGEAVGKASAFVKELVSALDFQYEISGQLFELYLYANRCLTFARRKKDTEELKGAEIVIRGLKESFEVLAAADTSAPVMKNTQAVYEGFTYGKDSRNQIFQNGKENRGFTV
jgi:flagellar protein FliS